MEVQLSVSLTLLVCMRAGLSSTHTHEQLTAKKTRENIKQSLGYILLDKNSAPYAEVLQNPPVRFESKLIKLLVNINLQRCDELQTLISQ